jgi:competence protein ComEA
MDWGKRRIFLLVVLAVIAVVITAFWHADIFSENEPKVVKTADLTDEKEKDGRVFYVYVSGAVKQPGVYEVRKGSRVFDAVKAAGDLLPYADAADVPLEEEISSSCHICVPLNPDQADAAAAGKININTAGAKELESLPGIGAVTAEKIIAYRKEHGLFNAREDIKKVPSIGDAKYKKFADKITL